VSVTRDEIKAAIAHFQGLLGGGDGSVTVGEIADRYYQSLEFQGLRAAGTERGRFNLNTRRLLGATKVSELNADKLEWYRRVRAVEAGKGKRPTKPATRNREVVKLSAMLTWAAEREIIAVNPLYHATMEPEDNIRQTCPTPAGVNRVLLACGQRLRAMVATKFWSGLRRGEICSLKRDQVNFDEGLIVLSERQTKTRRPRITILPERASALVREYLHHRTADSPFLFCTQSGTPVSGRNFLRDFYLARDRAGLEGADGERVRLHDLRAGFVGRQLELGTPERTIMDMTGHSTHEAFDRYVRVRRRWIVDAKKRVELDDLATLPRRGPNRAAVSQDATKARGHKENHLTVQTKSATR
jgi:integrase